MRANLAGSFPWALGVLALCVITAGSARAEEPKRQPHPLDIELQAPQSCAGPAQFEQLLRARLAGQAEPRASIAVTIAPRGAGVHAELRVRRAGQTTQRRLDAASCAEALNALSLVAALILDATPSAAQPDAAPAHSRRGARPDGRPPANSADTALAVSASSAEPASSPVAASGVVAADTPGSAADTPGSAEPDRAPSPASPAAAPSAAVAAAVAAAPAESRPDTTGRGAPRAPGELLLDLYASALLMTNVAPAIRPGAALGLGLGVQRAALRVLGEVDARAALPHSETTAEGSARFMLLAAGVRLCTEGLMARGHFGISGCASAELGSLAARGSDTDEPESARSLWAALGPGLRLAWYGARRLGVRLGSELLLPLTRPRYTLGEDTVFSVGPVTFRLELALRVRLL